MKTTIDLRTCNAGDILISKHGTRLTYIKSLPDDDYMDHEVAYDDPRLGNGSRTHDGFVYRKVRLESDEDIVEIIHL